MSRPTLDTASSPWISTTGLSPFSPAFPKPFVYPQRYFMRSEPHGASTVVWALPRSLAATCGITVVFSSSPYLDVSVQEVPPAYLWIQYAVPGFSPGGLPHSDIRGSLDICSSPRLFAAYHVFLRLLVPRHPPCALSCLYKSGSP